MADVEIPMSAAELQRIRQLDDADLAFFLHELETGGWSVVPGLLDVIMENAVREKRRMN